MPLSLGNDHSSETYFIERSLPCWKPISSSVLKGAWESRLPEYSPVISKLDNRDIYKLAVKRALGFLNNHQLGGRVRLIKHAFEKERMKSRVTPNLASPSLERHKISICRDYMMAVPFFLKILHTRKGVNFGAARLSEYDIRYFRVPLVLAYRM
uniref:Uncharacterized protein n=1 Tax=Schistocephalus solidus TaxID=70667 RepID=A0A0X3PF28_SCHSO